MDYLPLLISLVGISASFAASAHVILYKRDSRSAALWVGLVWLVPILGALIYLLLGINRLKRRAQRRLLECAPVMAPLTCTPACPDWERVLGLQAFHLSTLATLVDRVSGVPLQEGNEISLLKQGDNAYRSMIAAIDGAQHTVGLCSYIFDNDHAGQQFADALLQAQERGVEVRILIDAMGARYSWPSMVKHLRRLGLQVAVFNPTHILGRFRYANLRNHRKVLIADGTLGFTGGMNIRGGCLLETQPKHPIRDLHLQVSGPVVAQLSHVFASDWCYTTGEVLDVSTWFPPLEPSGSMLARGLADGPDEEADFIRTTMLGALATAFRSIQIVTPYFLPDPALVSALNIAAMRGVRVDIFIPEHNNLLLIQWACMAILWQVLSSGCRVWLVPPPFDHTKLMVVDEAWTFAGSANWDARSLRLNFEFNLECYDAGLAADALAYIEENRSRSREITLADVDGRPVWTRLRDGTARLALPFL